MKIVLYGTSNYDRGGKVRWLLNELGQEYEDHWVKNDEDYEKFLKVNPLGQMPAAMIDGQTIIESGAICTYLVDRLPEKGLAPSINADDRKFYLQWLFFAISVGATASRIMIIEDIPEGEVRDEKFKTLFEELTDAVDFLGAALEKNEYLMDDFGAADVFVGYHLYYVSLWPELNEIIEANAAVSRYLKRLKARPAAIASKVFTYGA